MHGSGSDCTDFTSEPGACRWQDRLAHVSAAQASCSPVALLPTLYPSFTPRQAVCICMHEGVWVNVLPHGCAHSLSTGVSLGIDHCTCMCSILTNSGGNHSTAYVHHSASTKCMFIP